MALVEGEAAHWKGLKKRLGQAYHAQSADTLKAVEAQAVEPVAQAHCTEVAVASTGREALSQRHLAKRQGSRTR